MNKSIYAPPLRSVIGNALDVKDALSGVYYTDVEAYRAYTQDIYDRCPDFCSFVEYANKMKR